VNRQLRNVAVHTVQGALDVQSLARIGRVGGVGRARERPGAAAGPGDLARCGCPGIAECVAGDGGVGLAAGGGDRRAVRADVEGRGSGMGDRERSGSGVGSVDRGDRPGTGPGGRVDVGGPGTTRATLDAEQAAGGDDVPRRIHDGGHSGLTGRDRVPAEEQANGGNVVDHRQVGVITGGEVLRVAGEAGPDGLVAHAGDGVGHRGDAGGVCGGAARGRSVHIKVHGFARERGAT